MSQSQCLLAYFGHHKCASSWLAMICSEVCRDLKLRREIVWSEEVFSRDLRSFVDSRRPDFLIYTNAHYDFVRTGLSRYRGFHVVRDPRDVCVSAYFSHRNTHRIDSWPELVEHRERLRSVSKDEGLLLDMDFLAGHFEEMASWPANAENVLELKMEALTENPYAELLGVFGFLGLVDPDDFDAGKRLLFVLSKACRRLEAVTQGVLSIPFYLRRLPAERLLGIVWEQDFKKKSGGRERGSEDPGSHYRKGVSGDWRNHFTERHVEHFKRKHNDLLLRYGYESNEDWS